MNRLERYPALTEMLRIAFEGMQTGLWTGMPGIIQDFDHSDQTASIQGAILGVQFLPDGSRRQMQPLLMIKCPVLFPSGGGFSMTFPIAAGDEVYVAFASRCIDGWWELGGVRPQVELRMHDVSDGFAFLSPRSKPRALAAFSTTTAQLRSDDGALYIELAAGHVANIVAPGGLNITGPTVFNGTVTANGKRIDETHEHTLVQPGVGQSGPVA